MKNFRELLNTKLENPEFKKEWDALEPEYDAIREMLNRHGKKYSRNRLISRFSRRTETRYARIRINSEVSCP